MSKVDAQRAMRDARYAAYRARLESEGDTPPPAKAPAAVAPEVSAPARVRSSAPAVEQSTPQPEAGEALCGHRSIGNKSCRRPAGHSETSHRYS